MEHSKEKPPNQTSDRSIPQGDSRAVASEEKAGDQHGRESGKTA